MILRLLCLLAALGAWSPVHAQELLPVEEAYKFSAQALDAKTLEVRFEIAKGYYLYRDKFRFAVEPAEARLGAAQLPPGKMKKDEFFGDVAVFRNELKFLVPVEAPEGVRDIRLSVTSQGCADIGVCYPPTTTVAALTLTDAPPGGASRAAAAAGGDESSQVAQLLKDASFWVAIASFFGAGLLLAFTPCMLPMVPILSGIIIGHGHEISRTRALTLSVAYVLGMAVTYAAAGVAAGLSGTLLSAALQNAWVLSAFAAIFVLLSLSMFGFYELQLPASWQGRLSETANKQKGGSMTGVTVMGVLSAIIVGPCVAAPLAGALLYISKTGDAVLGGAALFAMALGMGLPLIAIAVSARSLLPKAGAWMEGVKKFFGVTLLALALWIVNPVLPPLVAMLAWAALLILSAMYVHALDPLPPQARGAQRFLKGVGVLTLLTGAALLVGALAGSRDPLQPLAILRGAVGASAARAPAFEPVRSVAELDQRLASAGRPVMLDFYADWCVSCKEMERFTFSDERVRGKLGQMLLLKADVTANSADDQALLKRFGLFGPPGIIFFDAGGREVAGVRVVGFQSAEQFLGALERVLGARVVAAAERR